MKAKVETASLVCEVTQVIEGPGWLELNCQETYTYPDVLERVMIQRLENLYKKE